MRRSWLMKSGDIQTFALDKVQQRYAVKEGDATMIHKGC
ncbi:MAG: hypothetical protein JWR61_3431 [Ferruginibacter sp.]|nr:hypothetical protein [Ferruginibacter sp.]